jgi:beta-ureidopropionase
MKATCAVVQMTFSDDRERNVQRAAERVLEAARQGAQIICFPELATSTYFCNEIKTEHLEIAEPIPGPSTKVMAEAAAEAKAYVVFPMYEYAGRGELYNTAVVIDPNGQIVGTYRKISIPLAATSVMMGLEKYYFRPGNLGYPVFKTDLGVTIGVTICYDRHFPEGPRCLALAGADIIFVPTATANGRGIWETELKGHAIANLLWVAGVNRVGKDEGGSDFNFYGSSVFISPEGDVVSQANDTDEAIVYQEIDTELSERLRNDWGFFRDRRPDAYGAITAP